MALITHFEGLLRAIVTIYSYALDTNPQIAESPMVYIAKTARAEWG